MTFPVHKYDVELIDPPQYVYVASSWRNHMQVAVCAALRSAGIDHYDFKNPAPGDHGFHWSEVMESYQKDTGENQLADMDDYLEALDHGIAEDGFSKDFEAMTKADACILILPCGRSAHLELGFMAGQMKRTAILLDPDENNRVTPELMYKMVDYIAPSLFDLLGWLGVQD